jgi:hypothetical protein
MVMSLSIQNSAIRHNTHKQVLCTVLGDIGPVEFLGTLGHSGVCTCMYYTTAKNTQKTIKGVHSDGSNKQDLCSDFDFQGYNNTIVVHHLGIGIMYAPHYTSSWWSWIPINFKKIL